MITLFLSDLDGTLLNERGEVSEISAQLINKAVSDKNYFSIATARSYDTAALLMRQINVNVPSVLLNGALVCDLSSGKIYRYNSIPPLHARKISEIFLRHHRPPFCYLLKDKSNASSIEIQYIRTSTPFDDEFICECVRGGSCVKNVTEFDFAHPALYFTAMDTEAVIMPIYDEIKNLEGCNITLYGDTYHEGYFFLDIFAAGTSKAAGAEYVKKITGAGTVIAFGDSINDIPLLRSSDKAICVSNASKEVKSVCDEIIGNCNDDAVARYIYDYFQ